MRSGCLEEGRAVEEWLQELEHSRSEPRPCQHMLLGPVLCCVRWRAEV